MLKTNTTARGLGCRDSDVTKNNPCFSAEQPRGLSLFERIASCSGGSADMPPPGTHREQICHCRTIPAFCFPSVHPLLSVCLLSPCVRRVLRKRWVTEGQCHYGELHHRLWSAAARLHRLLLPPPALRDVLGIHLQISRWHFLTQRETNRHILEQSSLR